DNPTVPEFRSEAAECEYYLCVVLQRLGRPAEARDHCERAVAVQGALVKEHPEETRFRGRLAKVVLWRGVVRRDPRGLVGAVAARGRARSLLAAVPPRTGEELFLYACSRAALAGLAGQPGWGVSAAESSSEAEAAVSLLYKAVAVGYRNLADYRVEDALD